eukprot:jgi/Ulvmu1/8774/UM048_0029.1
MVLQLIGKVCSNKMDKSVVVIVEIRKWVNKYRAWKTMLRKYPAHDSQNTCNIGDIVRIEQLPQKIAKTKAFNVLQVLKREDIVIEDGETTAQYKSLEGLLQKRPQWAGLSDAAATAIAQARTEYAARYQLKSEAFRLARRLPGWDKLQASHGINDPVPAQADS